MIINKENSPIGRVRSFLPSAVSGALSRLDKSTLERITEIRLRANAVTTVTIDGKSRALSLKGLTGDTSFSIKCTADDIDSFIYKFCRGSVFTHEKTITENFITVDGIRVGLGCTDRQSTDSAYAVSSVNIRLARHIKGCSAKLSEHICENGFEDGKGILIISSPGVGKTTLLRDLAASLSCGDCGELYRVCVIDERNEIYMEHVFENCCADFISGIDKCSGIERATRLLSSQIIICDEIKDKREAEEITLMKNGGIVFIASFHADSFDSALKKQYIKKMFEEGVFSYLYLLERNGAKVTGSLKRYCDD